MEFFLNKFGWVGVRVSNLSHSPLILLWFIMCHIFVLFILSRNTFHNCLSWLGSCRHTFSWARTREKWKIWIQARPDLDPVFFFTNIQHPVCTWTYRDHGLTTYNWLSREKNRYTIISWCLFLSINAPKIKSCRLVEKSRTKVLYVDFSSIVFRF